VKFLPTMRYFQVSSRELLSGLAKELIRMKRSDGARQRRLAKLRRGLAAGPWRVGSKEVPWGIAPP
jgi:hypothetical protein